MSIRPTIQEVAWLCVACKNWTGKMSQ